MPKVNAKTARRRRHARIRARLAGTAEVPRLCVYRSLGNIYAQVIDDVSGVTLAAASSLVAEVKEKAAGKSKTQVAEIVGEVISKNAQGKNIKQVVFDRGGYQYHGRIKALADAARKAGLEF